MIHQEDDHQKTKFLNHNVVSHHNGTAHHVADSYPMIRDNNVAHARREVGAPVACTRVTTELGVSIVTGAHVSNAISAPVKRAESLHRKIECANGLPSPQCPTTNGGGVSSLSVKSSRDGYREKALEEIRNSLKPYATSDPHGEGIYEFSSASSSASESSGVSQNINTWGSLHTGPNGLNKNLSVQQALQHLAALGHNEESAYGVKLSDKLGKDNDESRHESVNGVAKVGHANSFKYKCQQKILDLHEGHGADNQIQQNCNRLPDNSRNDNYFAITGLRHKIFPDPPKLIYGNSLANCEVSSSYAHNSARQPMLDPSNSDIPPPLPPPRGTVPPPPTPPRGTPPLPPPVLPIENQHIISNATSTHKQYIRRMSPVPGRVPMVVTNNAQIHQQLAHQLQALSVNSNSSSIPSTSRSDNSQNGKSSWYSSPQPSYASSSSGRHSPTPTISSSEYSIPPVFQMKRTPPPPAYTPPSSYSSSPQPMSHHSPSPVGSGITSIMPRPAGLQAWSSRQAKSQSPVIMQSVKSTQVQKPVLQTAVAPTSPQPTTSAVSPIFPTSCQQPAAVSSPPPYSIHKASSTMSMNSDMSSPQDVKGLILTTSNGVPAPMRIIETSSNPPPLYPRNQSKPPSPMSAVNNHVFDPPPYPVMVASVQPAIPPSPPPPPYTSQIWPDSQTPTQSIANAPIPFMATPYSHMTVQDNIPKETPTAMFPSNESNMTKWPDKVSHVKNIPECTQSSVPTTDPPSYASSVAALTAQRAAALKTMLNNNVPTISGQSCVTPTVPPVIKPMYTEPVGAKASSLVNTIESICSPQKVTGVNNANINGVLEDAFSFFDNHHTTLLRKPSPVAMDTTSSASRSESPVSRAINQSPVSFMSTTSTSSPSTQSDSTHESGKLVLHKVTHQSPPPPRRILSREKENERRESKVRNYSPAAFKFFMEQHVENVLKSHQQRERRRQQLETEMSKVGLSEEAQCEIRKMLHQKESNYIRLKRAKMNKSMFTKIKAIGIGAFGEVALVRKKDTNQLYAMKTLRKSDVLKRNQVAHVKAERDILAEADNEWVVKLYYSFQDDENLYFVMDYIQGGDLMSLLIKLGIFSQMLAKFYIAELVLAVESVHKMGFIHRDIKPDNILIDRNGHIKLTDFGLCTGFRWTHNSKYYQRNGEHGRQDSMDFDEQWSNECHCSKPSANLKPLERRRRREHQRCLAHSLVGTPNYIAPEVLRKTGYTQLCDWWSVGVILYEMLIGQPPFHAGTPAETQFKVINWDKTLRIPKKPDIAMEAADLILQLCTNSECRLGRNGCDEIKNHGFFADIDFNKDLRKQPAPFVPKIRHPTDTSNFDPIDSDKLRSSNSESDDEGNMDDPNDNKHPEHAFLEFTFRRFFDDGGQVYQTRTEEPPDKQSSPVYV